ncbi:MAG: phosphotransferase [Pseudomonadota bacterium]
MSDDVFPERPTDLTAEHLDHYLRKAGLLPQGRVAAVDWQIIGTGKMGDNARFTPRYEGAPASAPATLVGKFPAEDEQARSMAGAQGAYYNEVMFYRDLAAGTRMRTPKIYASELSEDRASFLLLMEDMAPAEPGNQLEGASRSETELALVQAARLAAAYYGNDSIGARDYVMSTARDDGGAFGEALMQQYWPGFVDRFGHGLSAECIAFGEQYVQRHAHFVTRLSGPKTLAHGDFRSENILFTESEATTVDWQTTSESSVMTDAAYFLGGSVSIENRRGWERDLVEAYRARLAEAGVELDASTCWEQYREYAMHGLMITVLGASFSAPGERSDRMFLAMARGHLQQCVDLGSVEFL